MVWGGVVPRFGPVVKLPKTTWGSAATMHEPAPVVKVPAPAPFRLDARPPFT